MQRIHALCIKFVTPFILMGLFFPNTIWGITPIEEKEMSRKFMKAASKQLKFVNDPQITDYVNYVGEKILAMLPPQHYKYQFFVIHDDTYNAFAGPGGLIFIHTGLIEAMDNENELAGILGHEITHVTSRHISDRIERSKKIGVVSLAGLVAAMALGASGAGSLANAAAVGSIAAGQSLSLAYSREDEMQADQVGLSHITGAGYNVEGLLAILKKIKSRRWFGPNQIPTYLLTHPAVEERISYIATWIEAKKETVSKLPILDPYDFQKTRTRLTALYGEKESALMKFKNLVRRHPEDPLAHYGYGLIRARIGHRKEGLAHLRKALEKKAFDFEMLIDVGRVYFLDGDFGQALSILEGALSMAPDRPNGLFYLGRAHLALGNLPEALDAFKALNEKRPDYQGMEFFLAKTYQQQGDSEAAYYHLGISYAKQRKYKAAIIQLKKALALIKDPNKAEEVKKKLNDVQKEYDQEKKEKKGKSLNLVADSPITLSVGSGEWVSTCQNVKTAW